MISFVDEDDDGLGLVRNTIDITNKKNEFTMVFVLVSVLVSVSLLVLVLVLVSESVVGSR